MTWPWAGQAELVRKAEMYETEPWAVDAILDVELLTPLVLDPCCGRGVMSVPAARRGYGVWASDLYDWGYGTEDIDFLSDRYLPLFEKAKRFDGADATFFINPPFSKAERFIERAFELGARKIVCFQRFSWWEGSYDKGRKRGEWWERHRPARIYVCGDRASCWRLDISPEERMERGNTPTAHAWFVWERGHPPGPVLGHIYRPRQGVTELSQTRDEKTGTPPPVAVK